MDTPPPTRKPTDLAELLFAPQSEPNAQVLAQLAEVIREAVELARKQGPPKINLKKWEPADPDAAPTPLAEAVHQAEDAIRDIAAASQHRAKELAELARQSEKRDEPGFWARVWAVLLRRPTRQSEKPDDPAAHIQAAGEHLKKIVVKLAHAGIVVTANATEPTPVRSSQPSPTGEP